jgi:hypothetical protein
MRRKGQAMRSKMIALVAARVLGSSVPGAATNSDES